MSNSRHLVYAEHLSPDGYGIAFEEGGNAEFFVQDLLPGESAWVEIEHKSPHTQRSWARVVERVSAASENRVAPPCPAFGECGGCAWQHVSTDCQLELKRQRVETALSRTLAHVPPIAAPSPTTSTGYRNKGKYVATRAGDETILGAYKPRTHEVVSTLGCRIVEGPIDVVARAVALSATKLSIPVYSEDTADGSGLRYVVLRSNSAGEVLVLLVCTSDTSHALLRDFAEECQRATPVVGVLRCDNDTKAGAIVSGPITPVTGASTLLEDASGVPIALGPEAFWQLNREQASAAFRELASSIALPPGSQVVDLYCGVGAISFALAMNGYRVLGVEKNSEAIETAKLAAKDSGFSDRMEFRCEDATKLDPSVLAAAAAVVVDPPRKGLGEAGRAQLICAMPDTIAYLSCGPESLAHDLATLTESGYRLESVHLYEFMPGTSQVETLVILRKHKTSA